MIDVMIDVMIAVEADVEVAMTVREVVMVANKMMVHADLQGLRGCGESTTACAG